MQRERSVISLLATVAAVLILLSVTVPAFAAGKERVLHRFGRGKDGSIPSGGLIFDASGNLYGATWYGGSSSNCGYQVGCGTVFQLVPSADGKWTEKLLQDFQGAPAGDGAYPVGPLISDTAGNLYGVTAQGGSAYHGMVFKLTPSSEGKWTESVLYDFPDEYFTNPNGPLVFDAAGNLYGTLSGGYNEVVFELTPGADGNWTFNLLDFVDALNGGLIFDTAGNLYGTTWSGGANNAGTVFKLEPSGNGKWTESVVYNFCPQYGCIDGANPYAGVAMDAAGNLYGTTENGGTGSCKGEWGTVIGCGTVFELTPGANGRWSEEVLHSFQLGAMNPVAGLAFDPAGNLYGTLPGGLQARAGGVFKVTPRGNGKWGERLVHSFNGKDGYQPVSAVVLDTAGNLYGTTPAGGIGCSGLGCGVVYEITP